MGKGAIPGEFEQTVLLALARAGDGATGRSVYEGIVSVTGRDVALASVHVTLARLESKGLVAAARPEPEDGGRAIKRFSLTPSGGRCLRQAREHWDRLWRDAHTHPAVGNE